ncbi:Multiprotein-bridging factor [Entamoeba marina]
MSNFRVGVDLKDVYIGRQQPNKKPTAQDVSSGDAALVKKYNAGTNKKGGVDAKKIESKVDESDAPLVHKSVSKKVSLEIQKGRQAKKITQKELARLVLGVKLRGLK